MARFHEQVMGVYFDDLDAFGILHNARYIVLFERTLGSFWRSMGFGTFNNQEHPDRFHFVRANNIEYLAPVRGEGEVRVRVWIEYLGRTSLTFGFRVMAMDQDVDHARGSRTVVRVDPTSLRPEPWTPEFREQVETWLPRRLP